jgi:hypothetical protein
MRQPRGVAPHSDQRTWRDATGAGRPWTRADDRVVRRLDPAAAAERLGRTVTAVYNRRSIIGRVNDVTPARWEETPRRRQRNAVARLENDPEGERTVAFLSRVKRAASLISGNESRSLGLHPVVDFYGATGRFQPISFLATVKFVQELEERKQFNKFARVRQDSEEFLSNHKHFVSALGHTFGGRTV